MITGKQPLEVAWWKTWYWWFTGRCPLCGYPLERRPGANVQDWYWGCTNYCGYFQER